MKKTHFVISVLKTDPVYIEGTIHIRAYDVEKALEKIAKYGDYQIRDIREK